MNARIFLTVTIIAIAVILLFVPQRMSRKGEPLPSQEVHLLKESTRSVDVDKAAGIINRSDTNYQFIDLRSPEDFLRFNLPGSINIPFDELLAPQWQGYLKQDSRTNILYGNGDYLCNKAAAILRGKGYKSNITLKGGLNEWFATIMNVGFKGGRLTARENALFENRVNAKKLSTQINSLPDSLKNNFLAAKLLEEKELDGGCE